MSTYSSGASTYTATATGWAPATQVLPQVLPVEEPKTHREQPAWRAGYRCLLNLASILAGVCLLLWVIWGFTSDTVPLVARVLLSWSAGLTTMSAIVTVLVACAVRILGQHIDVVTTRATTRVLSAGQDGVRTLRGEMGAMYALVERMYARVGRLEQTICGRLVALEQRVVEVENRADAVEEAIRFANQRSWWLGYAQGARDLTGNGNGHDNVVRLPPHD